ncbi:hypothetical protein [Methylobacillus glycogenes]|uniref:hypothetical protein n=1 Tax=Methylobacillus glycogenes TaxID=406 RepID=UPI00131F036A|nr:hypothetical protein [Methylobacillus glycogenes]MBL8505736.1 hypothetical protein [Methylobacillus glycogenes]
MLKLKCHGNPFLFGFVQTPIPFITGNIRVAGAAWGYCIKQIPEKTKKAAQAAF